MLNDNKILIVTSLNPWDDIRIYKKEINTLKKKFSLDYIATDDDERKFTVDNVKIICNKRPKGLKERFKNLLKISKLVQKNDYKIFHIHNPELLLLVPFIKITKKKSKVIFDMHEDFEEAIKDREWIPKYLRVFISKLYRFYLNFLGKYFLDYIIVTTPLIKQKFIKFKNVEVIENFAPLIEELPKKNLTPSNIQKLIDNERNSIKVVFTGLINEQRGIINVIEAVLKLDGVSLFLIGTWPESFYEKFKNLKKKDLNNQIYLLESLNYDQMLAVMQQMDIGILPYLPFGNHLVTRPNKLFEYMATSLPVIASNYPLYKEVIDKGIGICINPCKIEEIIEAIQKLASSSDLRQAMGVRAFELYKKYYNWDVEEKKLLNIYNNLLGEIN